MVNLKHGIAAATAVCFFGTAFAYESPDTAQEITYNSSHGEDRDYEPAASLPAYTDNGDGTTTDKRTGLMWVKDGNSAGCNKGVALTWAAALSFCKALTYAGYSDWRLPGKKELMSIVDNGTYNPAINTVFFPNTSTVKYYWTATTYNPDYPNSGIAWLVSFYGGGVYGTAKTNKNIVRCVRSGP